MEGKLRTQRRNLELSIRQMSEVTGLDKGCLSRLERYVQRDLPLSTVRRVAIGYRLPITEVIEIFSVENGGKESANVHLSC